MHRGKRLSDGEWIYGYYWNNELGNAFIRVTIDDETGFFVIEDHEVGFDTVGFYTDAEDDQGEDIYSGDIVRIQDLGETKTSYVSEVYFSYASGSLVDGHPAHREMGLGPKYRQLSWYTNRESDTYCEIIGIIHDNPELLN